MGPIPENEILYPGDLVDVEYLVQREDGVLLDMAIHNVKQQLYADERFDYQGSRWESRTDKSGLDGTLTERRYLIITVSVRRYPKTQQAQQQLATLGPVAVIALITLISAAVLLAAGALIYYGHSIQRAAQVQGETSQAVLADPNLTPEQKADILAAQASRPAGGLASWIGSGVFMAGIMLGTIYLFTRSSGRGGRVSAYD